MCITSQVPIWKSLIKYFNQRKSVAIGYYLFNIFIVLTIVGNVMSGMLIVLKLYFKSIKVCNSNIL